MVTAGMTPRDAVRQLEARLTAAGCPGGAGAAAVPVRSLELSGL